MQLLRWRRDVRHFSPRPVAEEDLAEVLASSALAPSVGNAQPWRFVRLPSAGLREGLAAHVDAQKAMAARRYAGEGQEEAPEKVTDLTAHHCLGYTLAPLVGVREWAFGLHGAVRVPINAPFIANNGEALVRAACAGQGIVYAPRFMTGRWIAEGRLTEIAVDVPLLELGAIYALTHASRRPAARTRA